MKNYPPKIITDAQKVACKKGGERREKSEDWGRDLTQFFIK